MLVLLVFSEVKEPWGSFHSPDVAAIYPGFTQNL